MDRRGVIGLRLVMAVFISILVLGVLAIAIPLALRSLSDAGQDLARSGVPIGINESLTTVDEIGEYPSGLDKLVDCQLSITAMVNDTDDAAISADKYTNVNCRIQAVAAGTFNNTDWVVTGTYDYALEGPTLITQNVTAAGTTFLANTDTIYAILIVVVIIMAIAIVIIVVSKFGGGRGEGFSGGKISGGTVSLKRGGSGSGTLMGV